MRPVLGDAPPLCWEKRTVSTQEDHIAPLPSNSHKSTLKPGNPREGLKDSQGSS